MESGAEEAGEPTGDWADNTGPSSSSAHNSSGLWAEYHYLNLGPHCSTKQGMGRMPRQSLKAENPLELVVTILLENMTPTLLSMTVTAHGCSAIKRYAQHAGGEELVA